MISGIKKLALGLGITFLLGSSFIPLGCGGSEQAFTPVLRGHKDPEVPENVVRALKECVKQAPDRLARGHTAMMGSPALALLAPVSLAPVVIAGLAIIVVVAIVIYVATDDAPAVDCKKVKEECIATCSETSLPTPDYGAKFRKCMRACMAAKGCVF